MEQPIHSMANYLSPEIKSEVQLPDTLQYLKEVFINMGICRHSLKQFREEFLHVVPDIRYLKIQSELRESFRDPQHLVPSIRLCGDWLREAGFSCYKQVCVIPLPQLLIICPERNLSQAKLKVV